MRRLPNFLPSILIGASVVIYGINCLRQRVVAQSLAILSTVLETIRDIELLFCALNADI